MNSIGDRMKSYEAVTNTVLMSRSCVAIRLDGHNFSKFTRGFAKPFDDIIVKAKRYTLEMLCKYTQNCILGYEQSDEMLLLLKTYSNDASELMGNRLEKIVSLKAAEATVYFNESLYNSINDENKAFIEKKLFKAYFDCRAFNIPDDDAANLILWRVQDCRRNSIQSLAHSMFSHKGMMNKSTEELKEMIAIKDATKDWSTLDDSLKYGAYIARKLIEEDKKTWEMNAMIDPKDQDFYSKFSQIVKDGYYV